MKLLRNLVLFGSIFASALIIPAKQVRAANAAEETEKILVSNPFEDLIQDEKFKEDYYNGVYTDKGSGDIEFVNFSEYKYQTTYTEDFGLFVYFYNPDKTNKVDMFSENNKIYLSNNGTNYSPYSLIPVTKSTDDIVDMFYKFRININQDFYNSLNSSERKYCLSSFQLDCKKRIIVKDLEIGYTFKFTGYAAGCNGNSESTLQSYKEGLETIHLDVHAGYKRSGAVNEDKTKHIDLDYVYFEIPNKYVDKYGDPYGVCYEFYDCYTDKGIFNIRNHDYYIEPAWNEFGDNGEDTHTGIRESDVVFVDPYIFENDGDLGYRLKDVSLFWMPLYKDAEVIKNNEFYSYTPKHFWSSSPKSYYTPTKLGERLFRESEADSDIPIKDLENIIDTYGIDYFCSPSSIQYSGPLEKTIKDMEDPAIPSTENNLAWYTAMFNALVTSGESPIGRTQDSGETWGSVPAFEIVEREDDRNGSIYTINKSNVADFNEMFKHASDNDETMCILRFNESEYWTAPIYFLRKAWIGGDRYENIGYSAFEHIIDRFKIISLTFKMNDEYTVIPVVSDPVRIVPGPTAPIDDRPEDDPFGWFEKIGQGLDKLNIKLIIGIVAGVVLVFLVLKLIFKIIDKKTVRDAKKINRINMKKMKIDNQKEKNKNEEK